MGSSKASEEHATSRTRYATRAKVRQYIELARDMGMDVAAFEVTAEGAIKVMEARAEPTPSMSDYDRYKHLL